MRAIITNTTIDKTIKFLKLKKDALDDEGSFFAIITTEYDKQKNVALDFFDVIQEATNLGYDYVNTIVYPTKDTQQLSFRDNAKYIVWLCKNRKFLSFNKDAIREKHIWKDVEWGKRAKNYNSKGKDPGNVWIPTIDDGSANITQHILLDDIGVIDRLKKMIGDDIEIINCPMIKHTNQEPPYPTTNEPTCRQINKSTIVFGTAETMDVPANASVKLIVTSPPYWNLKDYFKDGQIGQESYETYLHRMKKVWQQCYNKLCNGGSLWININIRVSKESVVLIPKSFISICKDIGFCYKGIFIWHKSSGIPTGNKNIVDRHEYILVFSKGPLHLKQELLNSFSDYKNKIINGGVFWNINRKAGSIGKKYIHPAIYPDELVRRIILASTNSGDLVLDPFLGSGTTLIAAIKEDRYSVGYEFNEGFKDLIISRLKTAGIDASSISFINQNAE